MADETTSLEVIASGKKQRNARIFQLSQNLWL